MVKRIGFLLVLISITVLVPTNVLASKNPADKGFEPYESAESINNEKCPYQTLTLKNQNVKNITNDLLQSAPSNFFGNKINQDFTKDANSTFKFSTYELNMPFVRIGPGNLGNVLSPKTLYKMGEGDKYPGKITVNNANFNEKIVGSDAESWPVAMFQKQNGRKTVYVNAMNIFNSDGDLYQGNSIFESRNDTNSEEYSIYVKDSGITQSEIFEDFDYYRVFQVHFGTVTAIDSRYFVTCKEPYH
ncbi:hypothetical protein [Periweissella fabalis]|uniref:Uncharacterized protein n=1 Tax=Periweissella fabalis TaxID=1070421 RepID=A0A7X6N511_9LACO|nr:hypothetical protein [Periweissella fabalis]MCM0598099.1 hypothetical protein [Periweissella fabalis]NKZ24777.1 hypothetical protein [Periweissella fabalis]